MHSEIGIDMAARPDVVFALAQNVERWSTLLPHYVRSAVRDRRDDGALIVEFIARRRVSALLGLGIPVAWRARTWNEPPVHRLRFRHVAGITRGMDVTWRIEPSSGGSRVAIEHVFEPAVPGLARVVDRWFTRPIAGQTLATFKALAEAAQSAIDGTTNHPHG